MSRNKSWFAISLIIIAAMALSSCQTPATTPVTVVQTVIVEKQGTAEVMVVTATPAPAQPAPAAPKVLYLHGGESDIPTIDPALAEDTASIQVIEETTVGLVRQNELTTEIEKGMATDIQASSDGLSYTFKIRSDVPWVRWDNTKSQVVKVQDCNGKDRMVNAKDFEYGILRTLNPATASPYSYVLTGAVKGAADYNSGKATDASTVGVKAVDDTTLQITFLTPAIYNINIAGLWFAHAQPQWLIDGDDCTSAHGDKWQETGAYQAYGPYTLKEWVHDSNLTVVKNPFWPGDSVVPQAKIDEIQWQIMPTSSALANFEAGTSMDMVSVPSSDIDRIKTDPQFKNELVDTITLGTEFYAFNIKLAPTDDLRVRQALSMSIDRASLVTNVYKYNTPALFFTNPGVAGAPKPDKYPNLGVKFDPTKAKALLDDYLKEKNLTADKLNMTLIYNSTESNKKAAEAIQQMWKDNLGITVQLTSEETKVYYKDRPLGKQNIYRSSWVLDYPDANNFLRDVFGPNGGFNVVTKWSDGPEYTKFMDLINQAATQTDSTKRMDLYSQAEQILVTDEAAVAPLFWYSNPALVRSTVTHLASLTGYDHYEKWDVTPQ
jgi:oligopeptide transport system substrate-binding protein